MLFWDTVAYRIIRFGFTISCNWIEFRLRFRVAIQSRNSELVLEFVLEFVFRVRFTVRIRVRFSDPQLDWKIRCDRARCRQCRPLASNREIFHFIQFHLILFDSTRIRSVPISFSSKAVHLPSLISSIRFANDSIASSRMFLKDS